VDFAEDGERVDRLWIAAQICEGPFSTGLRLSTLMVYQANMKFRWRRNKTKSEKVYKPPFFSEKCVVDKPWTPCGQPDGQLASELTTG
jgi:hypothetical protein